MSSEKVFTEQYKRAIWDRKWHPQKLSREQFDQFIDQAQREGMDPLNDEIIATPRWDKHSGTNRMQVMHGINGLRKMAQRTGEFEGFVGPQWKMTDDPKEPWRDYPTPGAMYARVGVWRRGARVANFVPIRIDAYDTKQRRWAEDREGMGAKVAKSQAIRDTFGTELSGIYTFEEMEKVIESEGPDASLPPRTQLARGVQAWSGIRGKEDLAEAARKFKAAVFPDLQGDATDEQIAHMIEVVREQVANGVDFTAFVQPVGMDGAEDGGTD